MLLCSLARTTQQCRPCQIKAAALQPLNSHIKLQRQIPTLQLPVCASDLATQSNKFKARLVSGMHPLQHRQQITLTWSHQGHEPGG